MRLEKSSKIVEDLECQGKPLGLYFLGSQDLWMFLTNVYHMHTLMTMLPACPSSDSQVLIYWVCLQSGIPH